MLFIRLLALLFVSVAFAGAAPLERELGAGLMYYRIHELPVDLPGTSVADAGKPAAQQGGACVVDLRYVHAEGDAATAFMAWLKFRASTHAPVFVLANADTSAALRKALAEHERGTGIVVVGIASRQFHPDVAASGAAQSERRAYDALEQGAPIAALITDNPDKVRNDEASLSKDRLAEASADAAEDALGGRRASPPPIDVTLQRAVHLHRALLALKKL